MLYHTFRNPSKYDRSELNKDSVTLGKTTTTNHICLVARFSILRYEALIAVESQSCSQSLHVPRQGTPRFCMPVEHRIAASDINQKQTAQPRPPFLPWLA